MENKDLNENTENLTPDELLAKIKEKIALDIDTYTKIVDEETKQAANEDNMSEDFIELEPVFESVNEAPVSADVFEELDAVADFESTEEIEAVKDTENDVFETLEEAPLPETLAAAFDTALPEDVYEDMDMNLPTDLGGDTIQFNAINEEITSESQSDNAQPAAAVEETVDPAIKNKLAQLFSEFEDEEFERVDEIAPVADAVYAEPQYDNDATKVMPSVTESMLESYDSIPAADVYESAEAENAQAVQQGPRPKVYRFRKYDPNMEQTRLHDIVKTTEEYNDTNDTKVMPALESPDLNVMQTFGASVDYVRELYGENVATEYEKVLVEAETAPAERPNREARNVRSKG